MLLRPCLWGRALQLPAPSCSPTNPTPNTLLNHLPSNQVGDGVFEVLSTSGDTHLGGDDFDKRIVDWMAEDFQKSEGMDLRKDRQALQVCGSGFWWHCGGGGCGWVFGSSCWLTQSHPDSLPSSPHFPPCNSA